MKLSEKRSHIMRRYRLRYTHCQIKSGLHREVVDKLTRKRQTTPKQQQQMSEISLLGIFHGWGSQTAHPWKARCSNSINADFSYSNILTPYYLPKAAIRKYHRLSGLLISNLFPHRWRIDVQDQGVGRLFFPEVFLGGVQMVAFSLGPSVVFPLYMACLCPNLFL